MGCTSCAQKYAALKASRQAVKDSPVKDASPPRNVKTNRRGIIRRSEVQTPVEVPQISQEITQNDESNKPD